jgi:aminopeptidase N
MTLQALRLRIGDEAFFRLLKEWVRRNAGGNVTTERFIALAERVSGRQLDGFFRTWLYGRKKPGS